MFSELLLRRAEVGHNTDLNLIVTLEESYVPSYTELFKLGNCQLCRQKSYIYYMETSLATCSYIVASTRGDWIYYSFYKVSSLTNYNSLLGHPITVNLPPAVVVQLYVR